MVLVHFTVERRVQLRQTKEHFKCGGIQSLVTNTHPRKLPTSVWEVSRGCLQKVNVTFAVGK